DRGRNIDPEAFGPARVHEQVEIGDTRLAAEQIVALFRVAEITHPRGYISARGGLLLVGAIVPEGLEALVEFGRDIGERLDQPGAAERAVEPELRIDAREIVEHRDILRNDLAIVEAERGDVALARDAVEIGAARGDLGADVDALIRERCA